MWDREGELRMGLAKVFMNEGHQAIQLPESCRFAVDEVVANQIGNIVILAPKTDPWSEMLNALNMCTDDFLSGGIQDLPAQKRECL